MRPCPLGRTAGERPGKQGPHSKIIPRDMVVPVLVGDALSGLLMRQPRFARGSSAVPGTERTWLPTDRGDSVPCSIQIASPLDRAAG